jgi:hypothetical protein
MSEQTAGKRLLADGFLVAALTAIAYALAYQSERGFCSVFDIPTHLIRIDVTTVLTTGGALVVGLWMVFCLMNVLYSGSLHLLTSPLGRSIARVILLAARGKSPCRI